MSEQPPAGEESRRARRRVVDNPFEHQDLPSAPARPAPRASDRLPTRRELRELREGTAAREQGKVKLPPVGETVTQRRTRRLRVLGIAVLVAALAAAAFGVWRVRSDVSKPAFTPVPSSLLPGTTQPGQPQAAPSTVPASGAGTLSPISFSLPPGSPSPSSGPTGRAITFSVQLEDKSGLSAAQLTPLAATVLNPQIGWPSQPGVNLQALTPEQVSSGRKPTFVIAVVSPAMIEKRCGASELLCGKGNTRYISTRALISPPAAFGKDIPSFQLYAFNHEIGLALGKREVGCSGSGRPASVMQDQTKPLAGCTPWPWVLGPAELQKALGEPSGQQGSATSTSVG
ncbi:DUF3152 domain-containing protein [Flexivirga meconopsidis]|uniref:DUF3152 domain-containing protein n=1 Tax=Flexivirga meconopsidis TaxID=2977121 RepID=UPI00223FD8B3|nr:DUF3152 domain-containing protein [Flexivirga meconopsidis]